MTEIFGTGGVERMHAKHFFDVRQKDKIQIEKRMAFKRRMIAYRDTLIALGALRPGQKLSAEDVNHVLKSMGYSQKNSSDALKAAWGVRITFKELLQRLNVFDKEKKLREIKL